MFNPTKAFFFGGGDNSSVAQKHGGGVMVITANAQYVHDYCFLAQSRS